MNNPIQIFDLYSPNYSFLPGLILNQAITTKGIKKLSKAERAKILIPDEVKDVLIGILLGDAHIERRTATSNSRLIYAQTSVAHKEYFNHVLSLFISFYVSGYTHQSKIIVDKKTNKSYSSISFITIQLPYFNEYRDLFYNQNVKIVPDNIYDLLTPRGLAYWISDDGSRHGTGLHLNVYGFSNSDVDFNTN